MSNFEKDLMQSKEIEQLFRNHPKFPFLKLEDDVEENVLLHLFWRYMIKPYQNQLSDEWEDYSWNYYQTFRIYDDTFLLMLHFYGKKTRRYITLCPIGYYEDRFNDDHFRVNTGIDNSWSEVSGNKADELYFLGLGVDLRHPYALEAARDFFYAFFIDKLSLVEMEQKIIRFDIEEGWKFKRKNRGMDDEQ